MLFNGSCEITGSNEFSELKEYTDHEINEKFKKKMELVADNSIITTEEKCLTDASKLFDAIVVYQTSTDANS